MGRDEDLGARVSIALYVIGEPGVGKTTAIRELMKIDGAEIKREIEKPKWTIIGDVALAGHYRGQTFDGGDTVPYTGASAALEYWREHILPTNKLTIFDGDRFSTQPSLDFLRACGVRVAGVLLVAPSEMTIARRAQRGSNQNATWLKGRITKANNFASKINAITLATNVPSWIVAQRIRDAAVAAYGAA